MGLGEHAGDRAVHGLRGRPGPVVVAATARRTAVGRPQARRPAARGAAASDRPARRILLLRQLPGHGPARPGARGHRVRTRSVDRRRRAVPAAQRRDHAVPITGLGPYLVVTRPACDARPRGRRHRVRVRHTHPGQPRPVGDHPGRRHRVGGHRARLLGAAHADPGRGARRADRLRQRCQRADADHRPGRVQRRRGRRTGASHQPGRRTAFAQPAGLSAGLRDGRGGRAGRMRDGPGDTGER